MARVRQSPKLKSREARLGLKQRHEPYWSPIHSGVSIGYRKGARGGSWIKRKVVAGGYRKEKLGVADDHADADGKVVLSYAQAHGLAISENDGNQRSAREVTVNDVLDDYLEWHKTNSQNAKTTEYVINANIRGPFGKKKVDELTTRGIRQWHQRLAKGKKDAPTDAESVRKRKATANRVLTVFKAALNHAWSEDLPWRTFHAATPIGFTFGVGHTGVRWPAKCQL